MQTFLIERVTPSAFRFEDPDELARHCRMAADGYRNVGAFWLGGVVTDQGMFTLVALEDEALLRRHWQLLGIEDDEVKVRRVLRPLGPSLAGPLG